ncbi:MAG: 3-keto-disaccharide hydrolase [Bryobacteraceae bacterium]
MSFQSVNELLHRAGSGLFAVAICSSLSFVGGLYAQQSGAHGPRQRGSGSMIQPLDETGFQSIFDGKTLHGWDGDAKFWRVENGEIVGETSKDNQPQQNTFLIWRGGKPANFDLKVEFRLTGFNSGIQYRSIELPDIKYAMKGYQADMDGAEQYTGQIYEERGRGFLAMRGQFTYIGEGKKPGLVGSLGDSNELKGFIHDGGWNDLEIIARGNTLIQILNGHVMSMLIDDDTANRKMSGLIGIQVHRGPTLKIEVRNIRIKNL